MTSNKDLTSIILGDVNALEKQLTKETAPEINRLLKDSVHNALQQWYSDYIPESYERTYNFLNVYQSTKVIASGNVLNLQADCFLMNPYKGWSGKSILNPATAFDYMFMDGEHGHGRWMMHQSTPPYEIVTRDFQNQFGGQVQKILNKKLRKIFK